MSAIQESYHEKDLEVIIYSSTNLSMCHYF